MNPQNTGPAGEVSATSPTTLKIADLMFQPVRFDLTETTGRLVADLIDTNWVQRARSVRQLSTTYVTFPNADHTRFPHLIGACQLAIKAMEAMQEHCNKDTLAHIERYKPAVAVAALFHDLGQMAPGSHLAAKVFFPGQKDQHEDIGIRIVLEDPQIKSILESYDPVLPELVAKILTEKSVDGDPPPWTHELISGGGWNVDRGHWVYNDAILTGVGFGQYNPDRLLEALTLTPDMHIGIREQGLRALEHFFFARKHLYEEVYQHRPALVADGMYIKLFERARELGVAQLPYCDKHMSAILTAPTPSDLELETVYNMREHRVWYHIDSWQEAEDPILADLARRIMDRDLFKTLRLNNGNGERVRELAMSSIHELGFDPKYYSFEIATKNVTRNDFQNFIKVVAEDGAVHSVEDLSGVFRALKEDSVQQRRWLVVPEPVRDAVISKLKGQG